MRNWNAPSTDGVLEDYASRLPMRNWNWNSDTDRLRKEGFQTTYEELKQRLVLNVRECCACFQTTYEELKLLSPSVLIQRHSGFQTTYEELKHECSNKRISKLELPDYLWGIETPPHPSGAICPERLPDYLWGIETKDSTTLFAGTIDASRLPMRNWNASACLISQQRFCFQTTYEELKLTTRRRSKKESCFQTTYEELKHVRECCAFQVAYHSFQTTYEELKRRNPKASRLLSFASRLPMRNWNITSTGLTT